MTPSPDKLFRDGLEDYRKPAPAAAWDRIASGLHRKRRHIVWMRIAASITILLAVSVLFLLNEDNVEVAVSDDPNVLKDVPVTIPETSSTIGTIEQVHSNNTVSAQKEFNISKRQLTTTGDKQIEYIDQDEVVTSPSLQQAIAVSTPDENISEPVVEANDIAADSEIQTELNIPSVNIIYTSQDVKSKFRKKVLPAEATTEPKNTSGLQKVIDIALEIKNDDSMYGDLRQKKNEILSLSFLESNRGTNR